MSQGGTLETSKSIAEIQQELNFLKHRMEKLVPADPDIKALNDRSINEITSIPGLPTYLKVHLGDMHTPLYLNLKYHYDNPRDAVTAQSFVYLSGTSTRPSDANCQYKYKNVRLSAYQVIRLNASNMERAWTTNQTSFAMRLCTSASQRITPAA